jgi:hypothetical protein
MMKKFVVETTLFVRGGKSRLGFVGAVVALLAASQVAAQDSALAPLPSEPLVPPILRENQSTDFSALPEVSGNLFKYGPLELHGNVLYRYLYETGLPSSEGHVDSNVQTISPGLRLDAGSHWSFNYNPSWTYYSEESLQDSVSQAFSAHGVGQFDKWGVNASGNYSKTTDFLFETATQTEQRNWGGRIGGSRDLGEQFQLQLNGGMNARFGEGFPGSRNWTAQLWLEKQFTPYVSVSVGPSYGYDDISGQANSQYIQYLGRIDTQLTQKLHLFLEGGWEERQILTTVQQNLGNPSLDASLNWRPTDTTNVTFLAGEATNVSYLEDQFTRNKHWGANLSQRLLQRFYFSANYNHQNNDFISTSNNLAVDRTDKIDSFGARLSTSFGIHWTVAAVYQNSQNSSSSTNFNIDSHQYGFEINCRY